MVTKNSLKSDLRASKTSKFSGEMSSDVLFNYANFQKPPFKNPRSAIEISMYSYTTKETSMVTTR